MDSKYPNIKQSILLMVLIVFLMIILGVVMGVISIIFKIDITTNSFALGAINILAIGFFLLRAKFKTKCNYKDIFPFNKFKVITLIPIIIIVIGLSITLSEIDNILRIFLPMPDFLMKLFQGLTLKSDSIIGSIYLLLIVAPLTEELLFRGLILQSFLNQYTIKKSIIISSLLFAFLHLNPWQFISAFILGIIFSWWFINLKSLLPGLIAHSLFNSLPIFIKIVNLKIAGYSTLPIENTFQPIWFDISGVILLIVGFLSINKLFKDIKESN